MWTKIDDRISQATGEKFKTQERRTVGGGCINQGYCLIGTQKSYFVKTNRAVDIAMFTAEALGLQQMGETHTIRVPKPIFCDTEKDTAYLVLEWLDLHGNSNNSAWEEMGRKLAALHKWQPGEKAKGFGWNINNTIGSTPQINSWISDWGSFWAENRIGYQLKLAKRRGGNFPQAEQLIEIIPEILGDRQPEPSLVHGDLWGGNAAISNSGEPVIFDPATYIGDREVDIAMTELFGGFPAAFYRGYNDFWPLHPGYDRRKTLYNLYHILNHFNLFGGGYASQANRMIQEIIK